MGCSWLLVLPLVTVITAALAVPRSVRCPSPGSAAHRQVEEEDTEEEGTYHPGDRVYFNCTHGYQLDAHPEVTCHEDGQWDRLPLCVDIECHVPLLVHRRVLGSNQSTWALEEWVRFSCDPGYNLSPYSSSNLQCVGVEEGTAEGWDRSLPVCKSIHCPPIVSSDIDHGYVTAAGVGATTGWFSVGDNVTVTCNDGYQRRGPLTRTCRQEGTWSGTLQTCDAEDTHCGDPGQPVGGKKYGASYNEGDTVSFQCSPGRQMIGSRVRTCLSLGVWSGQEVKCMGKDEYMGQEELAESFGTIVRHLSAVTASKDRRNLLQQYENKPVELSGQNMTHVNHNSRSLITLKSDQGLDLFFAIDTSKSIPYEQRQFAVEIIKGVVQELGISPNKGTQVGLVAFNNTAWYRKVPQEIKNFQDLQDAVHDILNKGTGGGTAISKALQKIHTELIPDAAAARRPAGTSTNTAMKPVPRAVVLFSDGNANMGGSPVHEMEEIKKNFAKTEFYCVGLGDVNVPLLKSIATTETAEHLLITQGGANAEGFSVTDMVQSLLNNKVDFSSCGKVGRRLYSEGVYAAEGAWPWMGGMFINNQFRCGASLLEDGADGSRWVLTAAHCFMGDYSGSNLKVKFGSVNSASVDPNDVEAASLFIPAERVYEHPDYETRNLTNDIALIRLQEVVKYRMDIRPVCLPPQAANDVYRANTRAVMTGWGYWNSTHKTVSTPLKQFTINIFSQDECDNKTTGEPVVDGISFCGGGVKDHNNEEMDACHFDSGGPLVHKAQGADHWTQIGIVSFGVRENKCRKPGTAGGYVKLSSYIDWIRDTIADNA